MPNISDPIQIKSMWLQNRLVMAPIVTGLAVDNRVTDANIRWYQAVKGVGLAIVEASAVDPGGMIVPSQFGTWDDSFLPGLTKVAEAIHGNGAKALIQLVHSGGRSWRAEGDATPRMAPSAVRLMPGPLPVEMTDEDIESVIAGFRASAARAKAAGFDGVEIHGAHYYLLSQFMSPLTNHRKDKWGGDVVGRAQPLVDAIRGIRAETGPGFIISCRMHAVELLEGGMSTEDSIAIAKLIKNAGCDIIDASAVGSGSWQGTGDQKSLQTTSVPPPDGEPGIYVPHAARLKECGLPVIAVGRLGEPGAADAALKQGIDMVALARQIIADPQSPAKILGNRPQDIHPCIKCLNCFKTMRTGGIKCPVGV